MFSEERGILSPVRLPVPPLQQSTKPLKYINVDALGMHESCKRFDHCARDIKPAVVQIVPCTFNQCQLRTRLNPLDRSGHLFRRTKRIGSAVYEKPRYAQGRKVSCTKLGRLVRRMQRVGEQ